MVDGDVYPDTVIGLAVPTFLSLKVKVGVPITEKISPETKPEYEGVPLTDAVVLPS